MTDPIPTTHGGTAQAEPSRIVAIAGAGGGIGSAVAAAFRARGWALALIDSGRNVERLASAFPGAEIVTADLTDAPETARAVAAIAARRGVPHALVHLAGGFATAAATDTDPEDLEVMLDRNLRTLHATVRAVLPGMLERGSGAVVGVAARHALEGGRNVTAYAAAKGAVLGYLRALSAEVGTAGIGVGTVIPMGTIDTPANRRAMPKADPAGWISAGEMAAACIYLAERSPRGRVDELRIAAVTGPR